MTYSADSDQTCALLERVAAGDVAALEQLLQTHRDYLQRVVQLRIEPALMARIDASDVIQETQLVIYKRIRDFIERRPTSFRLWIRRKALEQLIDQRRRHAKAAKRSVYNEKHFSDVSSIAIARTLFSETPSRLVRKLELQDKVRSLIDQLSEKNREILTLRHAEGLSNNEVADLLEIPPNTVRQRYGRALRKLHVLLSEHNVNVHDG